MTSAGLECFFAICKHKTVSRAAQALFITQSSLSMRLKTLENELGGALFIRRKGSREMTLTLAGQKFYGLALKYAALENEMKELFRTPPGVFRVSYFNSLGTYLLPEVFDRFLQTCPQVQLELQDMTLTAATRSILAGQTDLAFTAGQTDDDRLQQIPAFLEPMALILHGGDGLSAPVSAEQLPAEREVCVEWSSSFARWHRKVFADARPRITISIMADLLRFLAEEDGAWSIVPVTVADGLMKQKAFRVLPTDFTLPSRQIDVLTSAERPHPAAAALCSCLREVIERRPGLRCLLPE